MKAALNGCLNLSVLDGWWDEWFQPDFGWAVPTADGAGTDPDRRDDIEAAALYDLLEQRVTPRFYERGPGGLPDRWIEMVRQTLTLLGPKVLAGRMVREYVERLYAPAALAHRSMDPDAARELAGWKHRVRSAWPHVTVDHVETSAATATAELGATLTLRVRVGLGGLGPDDVEVQAVSGRVDAEDRIADAGAVPLKPAGGSDVEGRWVYEGPLTLDRTGPYGYTVRILPAHRLLASNAELGLVAVPSQELVEAAGVLMR
jgi:starch phosphorylase